MKNQKLYNKIHNSGDQRKSLNFILFCSSGLSISFVCILFWPLMSWCQSTGQPSGANPSASSSSAAENKTSASSTGSARKNISVNFEDEMIKGQAQKPDLFYLFSKKQFNYKRLIRMRNDFLPEMRRSGEEIERNGSKN